MNRKEFEANVAIDPDMKPVPVEIKGWGKLHIMALKVADVDELGKEDADADKQRSSARAAAMIICDEDGKRLYDYRNEADLTFLKSLPSHKLTRILTAHGKLIGAEVEGN